MQAAKELLQELAEKEQQREEQRLLFFFGGEVRNLLILFLIFIFKEIFMNKTCLDLAIFQKHNLIFHKSFLSVPEAY